MHVNVRRLLYPEGVATESTDFTTLENNAGFFSA
jgi:hypothetical protein